MNLENGMTTQSENAILWIEKLLTAKKDGIKQGKRKLGDKKSGYCCLGYGCAVTSTGFSSSKFDSKGLKKNTGLLYVDGLTKSKNYSFMLVTLNDEKSWNFSQIAKRLQKYPHQYFIPKVAQSIKEHFA
jgi:hypothetical protein